MADSTASVSAEDSENQYLFSGTEFEDDAFRAASFVAKYRRVTSLESLKQQLRLYCEFLKKNLYEIINRDYKNFITISTKLDGVDLRIESLHRPLVDMRLDLSSLHDGLVSSMQAIQDKLNEREKVAVKKRIVHVCLSCIDKLDVAEAIIGSKYPNALGQVAQATSGIVQSKRMKRRQLLSAISVSSHMGSGGTSGGASTGAASTAHASVVSIAQSRDVFDCSEFERAGHALADVNHMITSLKGSSMSAQHANLLKSLELRSGKLTEQLIGRIKARLSAMFTEAAASGSVSASSAAKVRLELLH